MFDIYTKAVLTVIAISLVVLAGSHARITPSQAQDRAACGSQNAPCHVMILGTVEMTGELFTR